MDYLLNTPLMVEVWGKQSGRKISTVPNRKVSVGQKNSGVQNGEVMVRILQRSPVFFLFSFWFFRYSFLRSFVTFKPFIPFHSVRHQVNVKLNRNLWHPLSCARKKRKEKNEKGTTMISYSNSECPFFIQFLMRILHF